MIPIPLPNDTTSHDEFDTSRAPFAVLFDSDGVIVDSEQISLVAFRQASEEFIGRALADDEIEGACGLRDSDIVDRLRRRYEVEVDLEAYQRRKSDLYRETAGKQGVAAFPGVPELLQHLREERIPFALASSGPQWKIEFNLTAAGLRGAFDVIVSGEEVQHGKPAPDVFIEAARRLGVDPRRCLVVEDSINGIRAARVAGMACLAVTNTFGSYQLHQADRIVTSLEALTADDLGRLVLDKNFRPMESPEATAPKPAQAKTSLQTLN